MSKRSKMMFYGIGAAYLLYTAYLLFSEALNQGDKAPMDLWIFAIVLLVMGLVVLGFTLWMYRMARKEEAEAVEYANKIAGETENADNEITSENASEITNENASEITNENVSEIVNENANEIVNENTNVTEAPKDATENS